jgi:hypothetical protein
MAATQTSKSIAAWSSEIVQTNPQDRIAPDKKTATDYVGTRQKFVSLTQALARQKFL